MPLHTAEALVLRTYKMGEADRIVVFLTADRGMKRGVAEHARRPRSRFRGALEPLARYFEYWLLRLQGVYPESRGTLSDAAVTFLTASRAVAPDQVGSVPADPRVMRELETVHRGLISMHLEKTLKSDRVLRDLRRQ